MNPIHKFTRVAGVVALASSVLVAGLVTASSGSYAISASGNPLDLTKQSSELSPQEVKRVVGRKQYAEKTSRSSTKGFKGFNTEYEVDVFSSRTQMAVTGVARSKKLKSLPKLLKKMGKGLNVTSRNYSKRSKSGYIKGWLVIRRSVKDPTFGTIRVSVFSGLTVRGRGKSVIQAAVYQIRFDNKRPNIRKLIRQSSEAARILAKRNRI